MGLFTKNNRKQLSFDEKLAIAYNAFDKDNFQSLFFPGGFEHARRVLISLGSITKTNLDPLSFIELFKILSIYTDVLIRIVVKKSQDNELAHIVEQQHSDYVKDVRTAERIVSYCRINLKNNMFVVEREQDIGAVDYYIEIMNTVKNVSEQNRSIQGNYENDPDYGLIAEKPVYTCGVEGSERYLSKLETIYGEHITWKRTGSRSVMGVNGIVDIYSCYSGDGKYYNTIFINMYGTRNSSVPPKGFVYSEKADSSIDHFESGFDEKTTDLNTNRNEQGTNNINSNKNKNDNEQLYPGFNYDQELVNPVYKQLVDCGVDKITAYEIIHKEELLEYVGSQNASPNSEIAIDIGLVDSKFGQFEKQSQSEILDYEEYAILYGLTIEQAKKLQVLFREFYQNRESYQQETHSKFLSDSIDMIKDYPEFDFDKEIEIPLIRKLIVHGVPMRLAYEVTHREDLFIRKQDVVIQKVAKFCRKCGAPIYPESIFCIKCGEKIQL